MQKEIIVVRLWYLNLLSILMKSTLVEVFFFCEKASFTQIHEVCFSKKYLFTPVDELIIYKKIR